MINYAVPFLNDAVLALLPGNYSEQNGWLDSSSRGNHAVQADASKRPQVHADGPMFDGVDDYLQTLADMGIPLGNAERSIFIRYKSSGTTSLIQCALAYGSVWPSQSVMLEPVDRDGGNKPALLTGAYYWRDFGTVTSTTTKETLAWIRGSDNVSKMRQNGSIVASNSSDSSSTSSGYVRIGKPDVTDQHHGPFWGNIESVLIYNRGLSDAECLEVEAFLQNLTLGATISKPKGGWLSLLTFENLFEDAIAGITWTASGGVSIDTLSKKFGSASAKFSGGTGYLSAGADTKFSLKKAFTLEFWIKHDGTGDGQYLCGNSHPDGGLGWDIRIFPNQQLLGMEGIRGWGTSLYSANGSLPANVWNHVSFCATGGTLRLFINGTLAGNTSFTGPSASPNEMRIGKQNNFGGPGLGYASPVYLDDFLFINNYALRETDFVPPTQQSAYAPVYEISTLLHFDGNVTDESGKVWTIDRGALTYAPGKFGNAAVFSGTQHIMTPNHVDFDLNGEDFTVDFWVKGPPQDGAFNWKGNSNGNWSWPGTINFFSNGKCSAIPNYAQTANLNALPSTKVVLDNTWHHIALTRAGTTYRLFVDGILDATASDWAILESPDNTDYAGLGGLPGGEYYNPFSGMLDEYRVVKGVAVWTANFAVPTVAHTMTSLTPPVVEGDGPFKMILTDDNGKTAIISGTNGYAGTGVHLTLTDDPNTFINLKCTANGLALQPQFVPDILKAQGLSTGSGFLRTDLLAQGVNANVRSGIMAYLQYLWSVLGSATTTLAPFRIAQRLMIKGGRLIGTNTGKVYSTPAAATTLIDDSAVALLHFNSAETIAHDSAKGIEWTRYDQYPGVSDNEKFVSGKFGMGLGFLGYEYLTTAAIPDYDFGTGDFTIEFWIKTLTPQGPNKPIINNRNASAGVGVPWSVNLYSAANTIGFHTAYQILLTASEPFPNNVWTHIAVIRYQGVLKIYYDGVEKASVADATDFTGGSAIQLAQDIMGGAGMAGRFQGVIDELRIAKTAKWTTPFTAPTTPPPDPGTGGSGGGVAVPFMVPRPSPSSVSPATVTLPEATTGVTTKTFTISGSGFGPVFVPEHTPPYTLPVGTRVRDRVISVRMNNNYGGGGVLCSGTASFISDTQISVTLNIPNSALPTDPAQELGYALVLDCGGWDVFSYPSTIGATGTLISLKRAAPASYPVSLSYSDGAYLGTSAGVTLNDSSLNGSASAYWGSGDPQYWTIMDAVTLTNGTFTGNVPMRQRSGSVDVFTLPGTVSFSGDGSGGTLSIVIPGAGINASYAVHP